MRFVKITLLTFELGDEITYVIGEIEPQLCLNVIEILNRRVVILEVARGDPLSDVVFHI